MSTLHSNDCGVNDKSDTIRQLCAAITQNRHGDAVNLIASDYPFFAATATKRAYGPAQATKVFLRDGFVDRYTGERLVFPPVLRVISQALPEQFPFHTNWKTSACHPAFWEVGATVDHLVPVTRGGSDTHENWITTSMARNSAKMNWTLEELGWRLHPPGRTEAWDGLLGWFVAFVAPRPVLRKIRSVESWYRAARSVTPAL